MANNKTPIWKHDCELCKFMGSYHGYDVYHCAQEVFSAKNGGSFLARYGNESSEYWSMPSAILKGLSKGSIETQEKSVLFKDYISGEGKKSAMAAVMLAIKDDETIDY